MSRKITHKDFLEELYKNNESYRNGEFEVIGKYVNMKTSLCVRMKGFEYSVIPKRLLENKIPTYKQCVDKEGLFMQRLKEKNKKVFEKIKSIIFFSSANKLSVFDTIYGKIKVKHFMLERVEDLAISMAIDKTIFWVNRNKNVREDFEDIDYSKVKYVDNSNKVVLKCKKHNYTYSQRPSHHTSGVQGCIFCMKQTIRYTKNNFQSHKDFFKNHYSYLYVLKLSSNLESFYKVGMTAIDRLEYRLNSFRRYYNVETIFLEKGLSKEQHNTEQKLLEDFKTYKYKPIEKFGGHTECLTINPIDSYYDWYINNFTNEQ